MLVDVVPLRREGRRRLRAEVVVEMPVRGELTVDGGGIHGKCAKFAPLAAPEGVTWRLFNCRLSRLEGDHLVVSGVEEVADSLGGMRHQQAWWCRRSVGGWPTPYEPDPPSAVRRDSTYA